MTATRNILVSALLSFASAILSIAQANSAQQQELAEHLQKAQTYLREKQPTLAIPELAAAAAIDPTNVEVQGNLGVLLYFQGKFPEAVPHLRAALQQQSSLPKIQGLLGIAELHTLDFSSARKDMEAAFPLIAEPKFQIELGLELVSLDSSAGDLEAAASVLTQLRKSAPDNPEVLYAAYRTYSDLSSESMATIALHAPDSAQMHQILAHEEIKEGNTNGAIAQFRKAIAINPHLPGVHFELAELLINAQDPSLKKQAIEEFHTALTENPEDERAVFRLAEIDFAAGNTADAFKEYTHAAELQPDDADAKLGLAKILIDRNQLDKALALLEQAIQLEPTNPTAHYRLAGLYRKIGRDDDAKREVDLYKQYRDLKDKLRATYKDLLRQPSEIQVDDREQK